MLIVLDVLLHFENKKINVHILFKGTVLKGDINFGLYAFNKTVAA